MVMSSYTRKSQPMETVDLKKVDIGVDKALGKRHPVPKNGDYQSSIEDKVEEQAKKTRLRFLEDMDAIACGVEAWFEESTGYSRRVAETTADIARALGMPESEIKRWASSRAVHDMEKGRVVRSLLERLQRSFV